MSAVLRLPGVLAAAVNTETSHVVEGDTVESAFNHLFQNEPGLRGHLLDEQGRIRRHVSVFVDRDQAELTTVVGDGAEIRVLQAVSGGGNAGLRQALHGK